MQSILKTYNRYRSLQTGKISSLPIIVLMPHSACNCRCIMCDIWKGNHNLRQLTEDDIAGLLSALKKYGTQQVLMSGGEALLNPRFFRFCEILKQEQIKITLLSTGLSIKKNALQLVEWVNDIIVSLDGDETLHNEIRNIPGAYQKMKEGIEAVRILAPHYQITGRTVIHRLNFRQWPDIIDSAKELGLDKISFLPADVSSTAFNRETTWSDDRQHEILLTEEDLDELQQMINDMLIDYRHYFKNNFIAESPQKLQQIHDYYAAFYGRGVFPYKKCNAPWVSTVIEADGTVRPCFFHDAYGNIKSHTLDSLINSEKAIAFRKDLDINTNETCVKCVCYLNLPPSQNPV